MLAREGAVTTPEGLCPASSHCALASREAEFASHSEDGRENAQRLCRVAYRLARRSRGFATSETPVHSSDAA